MNKKEFLFRLPSKQHARRLLDYLDYIGVKYHHNHLIDEETTVRDSLYKQICMYEDKETGWPDAKTAESYPRKKFKRKQIKRILKKLTR